MWPVTSNGNKDKTAQKYAANNATSEKRKAIHYPKMTHIVMI
jgi:hypothetical protein